jgi:hypothetical protein
VIILGLHEYPKLRDCVCHLFRDPHRLPPECFGLRHFLVPLAMRRLVGFNHPSGPHRGFFSIDSPNCISTEVIPRLAMDRSPICFPFQTMRFKSQPGFLTSCICFPCTRTPDERRFSMNAAHGNDWFRARSTPPDWG